MIHLQGDGGHAKEIREIIRLISVEKGESWLIAVGDNANRQKEVVRHFGHLFCTLIHPSSIIARDVKIGLGTVVMAGTVIQPGTSIGNHVIVNTCASVSHDCIVGDFVHIAPGCRICGEVTIGEGAFLGAGTIVVPGTIIQPWAFYKAGSVVK